MQLNSPLPLASMFFKHWDVDDREVGVVVAKAIFQRQADGKFRALPDPELTLEDSYEGDPAWTPLLDEQDIAPGKDGTDLTLKASARSLGGEPRSDWPVEITIPDVLTYGFQVRGPAVWTHRRLVGWQRQAPEMVTEVPLRYSLAYGGKAPDGDGNEAVHPFNPAGIGFVTPARLEAGEDIEIPQIGALAQFMVDDPLADMTVHGFGPLAKSWQPRLAHAGTFDEAWRRDRHPRMPKDYSLRFWNHAHPQLRIAEGLRGDEHIAVSGISPDEAPVVVQLPQVALTLNAAGPEVETEAFDLTLDAVALDLEALDPAAHTLSLTWRAKVPASHRFNAGELVSRRVSTPPPSAKQADAQTDTQTQGDPVA